MRASSIASLVAMAASRICVICHTLGCVDRGISTIRAVSRNGIERAFSPRVSGGDRNPGRCPGWNGGAPLALGIACDVERIYMNSVLIPDDLYERLEEMAARDHVSVDR